MHVHRDFVKPAKTGMKRKLKSSERNQKQREQAQGDIQPGPHQRGLMMQAVAVAGNLLLRRWRLNTVGKVRLFFALQ